MDYTAVAEIGCAGFAAVGGLFGWLWRRSEAQRDQTIKDHGESLGTLNNALVASDRKHGEDLAAFKLHCAETYVTSSALEKAIDRFSESINAVFKKLERIDEKLDSKADKT
jgi:hypothetical protein